MFLDDWEQLDKVTIRPATPSDARPIARIHVDRWRSDYREILPKKVLKGVKYADRERQWMRLIAGGDSGPFVYVADHPRDGVVGFMAGTTEPSENPTYPGEVYVVYVADGYDLDDIGTTLVQLAARLMAENGLPGMLAWALADSPIDSFYRRLGAEPVSTRTREYGEATVEEIAFGWSDLPGFLGDRPEREPAPEQDAESTEVEHEAEAEETETEAEQ